MDEEAGKPDVTCCEAFFEIRPPRPLTRLEDATAAELAAISRTIAEVQHRHAPRGARVEFITGGEKPLVVKVTPVAELDWVSRLPGFVPGQEVPFVDVVRAGLEHASRVDMIVAFLMASGVRELKEALRDAIERGATKVRILTGDYLGTTEPEALAALLELAETADDPRRLQVRLYCSKGQVFHAKAYLFVGPGIAAAYVGSSNLSQSALTTGIEWNLRAVSSQDEFAAIDRRFEKLWLDPAARELTPTLLEEYRKRRPDRPPRFEPEEPPRRPEPHPIQIEALEKLEASRAKRDKRGLVVLATGLGKTLLSAFDFERGGFRRALFVAHREEILVQARAAWRRVLPDRASARWNAGHDDGSEILFASIQGLTRKGTLEAMARDRFDYVVIDEFHHAAAETYQRLLKHLQPRYMLGLTATPERADGAELLKLCHDNLVYRAGLRKGLEQRLLVPFHYYGLTDCIDYEKLQTKGEELDEEAVTRAVTTPEYARLALDAIDKRTPRDRRRLIVFCRNVDHADFMAKFMKSCGIAAEAVHSRPTSAPRDESLRKFKSGELSTLTAVDLFNEGLDVPDIDAVLMLRPTESPVIFLQQIGRGLRVNRERDKPHLTVVDVVGNHRTFLNRLDALRMLLEIERGNVELVGDLRRRSLDLPEGTSIEIDIEAINVLERLCADEFEEASRNEVNDMRPALRIRVSRRTDGAPILFPFNRPTGLTLPHEFTEVDVDGETYLLKFASEAVNVANRPGDTRNVLPDILRRWFGPNAGSKASYVRLAWRGERWRLEADRSGQTKLYTGVPLYRDHKAACGIGPHLHDEPRRGAIRIHSEVAVDRQRHFVIQAEGDSMAGGHTPIHDGDLVLCEWAIGRSLADVAGKPALLVLDEAAGITDVVLKVPIRHEDGWALHSWSPHEQDRAIRPGINVRVIARVCGTVLAAFKVPRKPKKKT